MRSHLQQFFTSTNFYILKTLRIPLLNKLPRRTTIVLASLLLTTLYVAVVGISIEANALRDKLAVMLSGSLGREVRFDGTMQLEISAHPKLKIAGMHIANAAGFSGGDFASLGEARLALDLWPLLRLRLQIEELSGTGAKIRIQINQDGNTNWAFKVPPTPTTPIAPQPVNETLSIENLLARLDIKRVSLEKLDVEFIAANTKRHFFELESLDAQLPAGEPIKLTLHGKIEKTHPYQLDFIGGSITELAEFERPWPIALKLGFLNSQLSLNGNVSGDSGDVIVNLSTQNLTEFEQLLQTTFPPVGAANISGSVKYAPGKISLSNLSGHMGKTTLNGALNVDYTKARPKVQGELNLPLLDLRPFMTDTAEIDAAPPKGLAEVYREIAKATFSLKQLNQMDADLTLSVGQWLNFPGAVHDAKLQIKLDGGQLKIPMQINMADVKLAGHARVDARRSPATFNLALGTADSSLGNLAGLLLGVNDVQGHLGRFDMQLSASGDRGLALMDSLDWQLNVAHAALSYGHAAGERPVRFTLDKLALALPKGRPLHGELQGSLLDKKFNASLSGGALTTLTQDAPVPLDFELQAGSAQAQIHAVIQTSSTQQTAHSAVTFKLAAPHSSEIASWLGLKPGADAPLNFQGKFNADNTSWHLSDLSLTLGRSDVSMDVLRTTENGRSIIKLNLNAALIDAEQLQTLLPDADKLAPSPSPAAVSMMDIPILPSGISLADADIAVSVKRIKSSSALGVADIKFDGQIRDGMMPISPFSVKISDNNFAGAMSLDLRTQQPHAIFWVAADHIDVGNMLKKIGVTSNIDALIEHASFQLDLHSSRLGQLLAQSELVADLQGGHFSLSDANNGGKMLITLDQGVLQSAAGEPISLKLQGSLNKAAVNIDIHTGRAQDLIDPSLPLPFSFNAHTSGASINLAGDIERPLSKQGLSLALDMRGSRFDNLNALVQTALPPWGPWSASGKFNMSSSGYEISTLRMQVGTSQLIGYGKLDTTATPPRLDVALTAPTIQLDDFKFGVWSLEKARPAAPEKTESKTELSQQANEASQQAQQILSPEILSRQNAFLTVKVDQVVSGKDLLGSAKLEARLENGRAALGPVLVNTPGGSASIMMKYEPSKKDVLVNLRVEANNFDYGILARRIDHKSEMSGMFSLNVDINGRTQYLSDIFKYGKGRIDFAVWPDNLKSGLLDIWAVNVLMALLPAVDSSDESKVNCAIGKFELANGKLSEKSILIDTSRMRVAGKGGVDFNSGKIQLYLQPHAKTPQFLSFAIPIELRGSFDEFSVGVRAADALEYVGQLATSVIWVPLQTIFGRATPADGRDVCRRVGDK